MKNTLHFLVLFSAFNNISVGGLVLQKCCPIDYVFNVNVFACQPNNVTWAPDLLEDYTNVTWSILKDLGSFNLTNTCEDINVLKNVTKEWFYLELGNLVQRSQPGVQHRDFCLDQTSEGDTLALTCPCSKGGVCVNVCCDDEEILDVSAGGRCVHQGEKTVIDWKLSKSEQLFSQKYNSIPQCSHDTGKPKILNYKNNLKQYEFDVLANGSLLIHNGEIKEWKEPSEYCVAVTKEGTNIMQCSTLDVVDHENQTSQKTTIYVTLLVIGAIFYLATLLVHALVPDLRSSVRGLSLTAHCACMLAAHIVLSILHLIGPSLSEVNCQILAHSCKFTFMGGIFWLNVMCLDISNNFKSKKSMARSLNANYSSELRKFQWYCIYAFGVPFLLMVVTLGVDHSGLDRSNPFKPNIGLTTCWFEKDSAHAIVLYFYGPLGLLLLINTFLFIFVGYKFANAGFLSKNMPSNNSHRYRKRVILFLKLSALMGIPWIMEIVAWAVGGEDHYWYFTDAINLLRSVFIFFMFCCKSKVWEMLKNQSILAPLFQRFSCCRKVDPDNPLELWSADL